MSKFEACVANPFVCEGKWFRGCLHVHTNQSDGALSPEDMTEQYHAAGYDFICITDHEKATEVEGLSSDGFIVISSHCWGEKFTAPAGRLITEACYTIRGKEPYVRVSCTDAQWRCAWSNPLFCP